MTEFRHISKYLLGASGTRLGGPNFTGRAGQLCMAGVFRLSKVQPVRTQHKTSLMGTKRYCEFYFQAKSFSPGITRRMSGIQRSWVGRKMEQTRAELHNHDNCAASQEGKASKTSFGRRIPGVLEPCRAQTANIRLAWHQPDSRLEKVFDTL